MDGSYSRIIARQKNKSMSRKPMEGTVKFGLYLDESRKILSHGRCEKFCHIKYTVLISFAAIYDIL